MTKLTKMHFEAIAETLKESKPDLTWLAEFDQWKRDCNAMADVCYAFNPAFSRSRFLEACGVETENQ